MKGIQPKNRVKLCVDCHGEQQKRKAAKDAQSQTQSTEQKRKVMLQSNTTSEQKDKK